MNFEKHMKQRMEAGAKEHEGNEGDWANWKETDFLDNIQEELADCGNYIKRLLNKKSDVDILTVYNVIRQFHGMLNIKKKKWRWDETLQKRS